MNNKKPSLIGLYILYTVILIAAVVYLNSRGTLSVQISTPAIEEIQNTAAVTEEMQDTAAATLPAEEVLSEEEASLQAESEETASNEELPAGKQDSVEQESAQVTAADDHQSLHSPDSSEEIASEPKNPCPAIPFISKCRINLHIRQYPSMSGKIIGRIPTRASGVIIELVDDEWAKVIYKEITGYSAYRYLDFDPSFITAAIQEENKEPAVSVEADTVSSEASSGSLEEVIPQVKEQDVIVIRSSCYIRSSAGDKNKRNIIMTAQGNDVFPHMPAYDQPSWYAIAVEGQSIAFVSTKYSSVQTIPVE